MSDLVALSPKEAVQLGATSLTKYGKLFFPRTFRQDSPSFHEDIGRALYSHDRYNAFKVFRGGAKTSLLRVYASQRAAYGISRFIGWVSTSQLHAKFSLRWLRRQVEHNKRWADTFGLRPGKKWTDEWMEIECHLLEDEHAPGQPVIITILALGITGQIRGFNPDDFRFDLLLLDDVLDDENAATPEQRKKIDDLIFGALLKSLAPASEAPLAKAVFLQTPMNREDSMEKCMKDPEWHGVEFGCFDQFGKSRWETRLPTEVLLKEKEAHIRRSQYRLWMREMEVKIVSGEEKAINVETFKYWDVLPEQMDKVVSVDPASSEGEKADKHVTVGLGFKGLDVYVIVCAVAFKNQPDKAANDFFNAALLLHPRKGVVESNAYQRVFKWILEQEMIKRKIFVAMELLEVKTKNADRIMQTIPGLSAYGHFWIHKSMTELVTQADDYDPSIKDIADDILTAIANGIISANPALMLEMTENATGELSHNEDEYKPLRLRAAP